MGNTYATILAQLVHEAMLVPSLTKSIGFRAPEASSAVHVAMKQHVRGLATAEGMVPVSEVPVRMLNELLAPALVWSCGAVEISADVLKTCDWLVPLSAFEHEPSDMEHTSVVCMQGFNMVDGSARASVARIPGA